MPRTYRLIAVLYAVLVVIVSSWPSIKLPNVGTGHIDKILHFGQYALFAYLAARGWWVGTGGTKRRGLVIALILAVFAAVDEYHQGWIPGRDADWRDFIADGLGVAAGLAVGRWWGHRHLRDAP